MRYILALLVMLLVGCGTDAPSNSLNAYTEVTDSRLNALFSEFLGDAEDHGIAVPVGNYPSVIEWKDQPYGRLALCYTGGMSVSVSPTLVDDPLRLRAALWHELGHCTLHLLGHSTRVGAIMAEEVPVVTEEEWPALLDEFFAAVK